MEGGKLTIGDNVVISADATQKPDEAYGVYVYGGTANIEGTVDINASHDFYVNGGTANILDGTVSYDLEAEAGTISVPNGTFTNQSKLIASGTGTISVYGGEFNGESQSAQLEKKENGKLAVYAGTFSYEVTDSYLAPDSVCTKSGNDWIVEVMSTLTFDPASLDVAQGKTGTVTVSFLTKDGNACSLDKIEVTPTVDGITVTTSPADGTITFEVAEACEKGSYDFAVACTGKYGGVSRSRTDILTVTVKEKGDDPTPTPTPSGDVKNGGCNAGFAGLALAAFALLAAKRKK